MAYRRRTRQWRTQAQWHAAWRAASTTGKRHTGSSGSSSGVATTIPVPSRPIAAVYDAQTACKASSSLSFQSLSGVKGRIYDFIICRDCKRTVRLETTIKNISLKSAASRFFHRNSFKLRRNLIWRVVWNVDNGERNQRNAYIGLAA